MKKLYILLIGLSLTVQSFCQTINIQGGASTSILSWQYADKILVYNEALLGYSYLIGLEYLDKKYFNLSTNLGMLRKGGRETARAFYTYRNGVDEYIDNPGVSVIVINDEISTLDYLSLNTTFDLKYPINEIFTPFISFGPHLDYLISKGGIFKNFEQAIESKSVGVILGGGIKVSILKFQVGFRADYYFDFNEIAEWEYADLSQPGDIRTKTFILNFILGYKLN